MIWREPCPVPSRWVLDALAEELLAEQFELVEILGPPPPGVECRVRATVGA